MKLKTLFITLLLLLILSACQNSPENQSSNNLVITPQSTNKAPYVPESVKIDCHAETSRTLEPFERIEPNMSFNDACALIGLPDQDVGSGLHIFVYHLEDDSRVLVGFASYDGPVLYLIHRMSDGTEEWLTQSKQ